MTTNELKLFLFLTLVSVSKMSLAGEFFPEGIYQIKLAQQPNERDYGYHNGPIALHSSFPIDIRDKASCYAHVRSPKDLTARLNSTWKIEPNDDGTFNIRLYDKNNKDSFSGGLLAMHRSKRVDERDEYSTFVHVRKASDPQTTCTKWNINQNPDGSYQIKLVDENNTFQYDGGLLSLHSSCDADKRDHHSAYLHVRSPECIEHRHNCNWNIVMQNPEELIHNARKAMNCEKNTKIFNMAASAAAVVAGGMVVNNLVTSVDDLLILSEAGKNACVGAAALCIACGAQSFLKQSKFNFDSKDGFGQISLKIEKEAVKVDGKVEKEAVKVEEGAMKGQGIGLINVQ